jgi:hypothetical protein
MKRKLLVALSLVLVIFMVVGCTNNLNKDNDNNNNNNNDNGNNVPAGETLKTGYAVITTTAKSADAGDKEGFAQIDSTAVVVTVDKDGKIVECIIDAVQTKINFSTEGKVTTDLATVVQTKNELGPDYGMVNFGGAKKEWNEQAAAFAQYAVGKTVADLKGIAVNEKGATTDADLAASVTIGITGFVDAIEKAVATAADMGAKAGDKLGLGIVTTIAKSADFKAAQGETAAKDGQGQAYSYYTIVTSNADGKITSAIVDATQGTVTFDATGKITSDIAAEVKTKNELGDAYGMKKASGIKKEWNEQAKAFADYVVGKTVEEVKGIAVSEKGSPAGADLTASVTVGVTDIITAIEKALTK